MSFNETNSFQSSQFGYTRTIFRTNAGQQFISMSKLIDQCSKFSILIIQLPDKRLENGLNILPLKAKLKNSQQIITIFVTKFNQKNMSITAYFDGKKIDKSNASNQEEIARIIKKWVESKKSVQQDYQKQSLEIIEKLNKKCTQLAKQQKNQMIVIQKVKSTREYQSLIEQQIQLAMQIESLSQMLINLETEIDNKKNGLVQKILIIQNLKNQIQEYQYEYEELSKCFKNVKQNINLLLEKQKQAIQKMSITSQEELINFLVQAQKLKKLELQKRFLH